MHTERAERLCSMVSLCPGGPAVEIYLFFCYSADHFYIYNFVADVLGGLPHLSGPSLKMTEGE